METELLFSQTNNLGMLIVFGLISIVSGILNVKIWKNLKQAKAVVSVHTKMEEKSFIGMILTGLTAFIASIGLTIAYIFVYLLFLCLVNIGITWAIGLWIYTDEYYPFIIYIFSTCIGIAIGKRKWILNTPGHICPGFFYIYKINKQT